MGMRIRGNDTSLERAVGICGMGMDDGLGCDCG